jgi:hypothetical protein
MGLIWRRILAILDFLTWELIGSQPKEEEAPGEELRVQGTIDRICAATNGLGQAIGVSPPV